MTVNRTVRWLAVLVCAVSMTPAAGASSHWSLRMLNFTRAGYGSSGGALRGGGEIPSAGPGTLFLGKRSG